LVVYASADGTTWDIVAAHEEQLALQARTGNHALHVYVEGLFAVPSLKQ
jgi:hypothetical protein